MLEKKSLSPEELSINVNQMAPEWKSGVNEKGVTFIERVHHAKKFMQGIEFVQKVAQMAEDNNHHPDIFINYKRITVRYWTHTAGGVTLADVQMAQKIDVLFE
jgi:4a-hydroxytetrahydrobiopterin dehydratase